MNNNQYSTLSEATNELSKRGFSVNFEVNEKGMLIDHTGKVYSPSQIKLKEFHRFEGESNPADSTIIYAVETKSGIQGTVVDSYGADGSEIISDFMNKAEQDQFE